MSLSSASSEEDTTPLTEPLLPNETSDRSNHVNNNNDHHPSNSSRASVLPREHTYLPGVSNALFPEALVRQRRMNSQRQRSSGSKRLFHEQNLLLTLPILELEGVVCFPGTTLPLRLRHPKWIEYLGSRIDANRRGQSNEEVQIGVVTRLSSSDSSHSRSRREQRRRSSWMRTGIDRRSASNILQRLLIEGVTGAINGDLPGNSDRRVVRREGNDDDEYSVYNAETPPNQQLRLDASPQDSPRPRRRRLSDVVQDLDQQLPNAPSLDSDSSSRASRDSLIGRVGTIVTVAYTQDRLDATNSNEDDGNTISETWEHHANQRQLVVKALGTSRFKVKECVDEERRRPMGGYYNSFGEVQRYRVEEILESEPTFPSLQPGILKSHPHKKSNDRTMRALSVVTPWPEFVFRKTWPWSLMTTIQSALQHTPSMESLSKMVRDQAPSQPMAFSFWMVSNMALTEKEKLKALHMDCTSERLLYIRDMILTQDQVKSFVCCKACRSPLSEAFNVFSVEGAEGTSGAYVNEHGVVHQTLTVQDIKMNHLWYQGPAETRDSWFPGYAWTIMYCRRCHSHLGWLFTKTGVTSTSPNRPDRFWGLSQSSVSVIDRPLRRHEM